MFNKIEAIILVFNIVIWTLLAALRGFEAMPTWLALFAGFGSIWVGCMTVASLLRDRL